MTTLPPAVEIMREPLREQGPSTPAELLSAASGRGARLPAARVSSLPSPRRSAPAVESWPRSGARTRGRRGGGRRPNPSVDHRRRSGPEDSADRDRQPSEVTLSTSLVDMVGQKAVKYAAVTDWPFSPDADPPIPTASAGGGAGPGSSLAPRTAGVSRTSATGQ